MAAYAEKAKNDLKSIQAENMWARATVGTVKTGAVYGKLTNLLDEDDALVAVSTPIAGMAELHRTTMDDNGYMTMDHVERIVLKKNHFVMLEPGDLHIMLMRVKKVLKPGDEIPLKLEFEKAQPINVRVKVYPINTTWQNVN